MDEISREWIRETCKGDHEHDAILKFIYENYPKTMENVRHSKGRAQKVVADIQNYIKKEQLHRDQKIGIVAHSMYFRVYTAEESWWETATDNKIPPITISTNLPNCGFIPDQINFPL